MEMGFLIDIERFVLWTYKNSKYIENEYRTDSLIKGNTVRKWRRYETLPSEFYINAINNLIDYPEEKFERINIADLLLCVNNAKDHNRGSVTGIKPVNSTGKKVLNLLLLGRILDGNKNDDGYFSTYNKKNNKTKDKEVWEYLSGYENVSKQVKTFYYLPGRTVSCKQLQSVGQRYKNAIKPQAIPDGLKELQRVGIVKCVDKKNKLYKLDYAGCKLFLEENMY